MKKGQIYEGVIERVDFPNKGLVHVPEEDRYVTVKNGIPGQKVRFVINKFKKGNAEGRLLEVLEKSPLETREPVCSIFPACGGCMYQTMPYEEQMKMKEGQIRRLMDEAVRGSYIFEGVKASPKEFGYRNKMEFSFGDEYKDGPLSLGLHKKGSTYDVLTAADCKLVHADMNRILVCVLEYFKERGVSYYHKMQHTGYLRHLLLRRGDTTGEILVSLVTTTQEEHDLQPLVSRLLELELGSWASFTSSMTPWRMWCRAMRQGSCTGKTSSMRGCWIWNSRSRRSPSSSRIREGRKCSMRPCGNTSETSVT